MARLQAFRQITSEQFYLIYPWLHAHSAKFTVFCFRNLFIYSSGVREASGASWSLPALPHTRSAGEKYASTSYDHCTTATNYAGSFSHWAANCFSEENLDKDYFMSGLDKGD